MSTSRSNRRPQSSPNDNREAGLGDALEQVQVEQAEDATTPPLTPETSLVVPPNPFKRALNGMNGPYASRFNPMPGTPMPTGSAGLSAALLASSTTSTKKPKSILRKEIHGKLTICDMGGESRKPVFIAAQNFFIMRQVRNVRMSTKK